MKRRVLRVVIIVGLLIGAWYAFLSPVIVRVRQNNASVDMMVAKGKIEKYVRETGDWPRSWQDLFPEGMTSTGRTRDVSRTVKVNWQASIGDIVGFIERVDAKERDELVPPEVELPVLVGFTDRVPRNHDLVFSERSWNWAIAKCTYRDRHVQYDK